MRTVRLNGKFNLNLHEQVRVEQTLLVIEAKKMSTLRPPKGPHMFILQLELTAGDHRETISFDGEADLEAKPVARRWGEYEVTIVGIDYLANFATLCVFQNPK